MSSSAAAQPMGEPHEQPPAHAPAGEELNARTIGVSSATGLVIGSIIGTGVFVMPAVLAGAGTSSLATNSDIEQALRRRLIPAARPSGQVG